MGANPTFFNVACGSLQEDKKSGTALGDVRAVG